MTTKAETYDGSAIEVLEGLEPVRRRPGMYTDTTSPNHLGMEVIDNSVDEALAGFANYIEVILHQDESLEVVDNGRGMPVDTHPTEKVPAVELIFGRLHAGGKFNSDTYGFSAFPIALRLRSSATVRSTPLPMSMVIRSKTCMRSVLVQRKRPVPRCASGQIALTLIQVSLTSNP